jgi:large subunit ribosomal protein L20
MPRVKRGFKARRRRKKILKLAKGFRGARSRCYRQAKDSVEKALCYAYRDRRAKKRDFRGLWIQRINAACRLNGISYSKFIGGLNKAGIGVDRKIMANLAVTDPNAFTALVEKAKAAISA